MHIKLASSREVCQAQELLVEAMAQSLLQGTPCAANPRCPMRTISLLPTGLTKSGQAAPREGPPIL